MGVVGIGGLFFRSKDPETLSDWYAKNLGVGPGFGPDGAQTDEPWTWRTSAGPIVFAPFPETTDYFPATKAYMLNLRVVGLDDLVAALRANGVEVEQRAEWNSPETGQFARLHDPEGNPIELWEPPRD